MPFGPFVVIIGVVNEVSYMESKVGPTELAQSVFINSCGVVEYPVLRITEIEQPDSVAVVGMAVTVSRASLR